MNLKVKLLVMGLLSNLLFGCAVFEGGEVPKVAMEAITKNQVEQQSVVYNSVAMGGLGGESNKLPEAVQSIIEGELESVLKESNYFSRVSKVDDEADVRIELTLTNRGNPAALIPAFITGLSLYTIPSWATDHFEVKAKVSAKQGMVKEYELNDSVKLVQWLPMIFVFPAKNFSVVPEVRKNMYRNLLVKMQEDGFFADKAETVSLSQ